jgi:hypothetical protein
MNDKEMGLTLLKMLESINERIIDFPMQRRKYIMLRSHIEKALRVTGNGVRRELKRPESLPIFQHELKTSEIIIKQEEPSSIIADNAPEQITKKNRGKK